MSTSPRYSPDGKWWWDGQQWVPASQAPESLTSVSPDNTARPKVGRLVRLAGCVGAIASALTGVVILFQTMGSTPQPNPTPRPNPPSAQPVTVTQSPTISFTVADELGPLEDYGLVSEHVAVIIDGTTVGTMTVDVVNKTAEMVVTQQPESMYSYQLASVDTFDVNGRPVECEGQGSGSIVAKNGDRFGINFMAHSCPLQLVLVHQGSSTG